MDDGNGAGDDWCRGASCWLDQLILAMSKGPALGAHLSHSNPAVCESSGECECFDRNMSRHIDPDLPWDCPLCSTPGI